MAKTDNVPVSCPRCGYSQPEPRSAYSTICKNCGQHFRLEEARKPAAKAAPFVIEQKHVRCFQCGTELEAPKAASSTMCKRCSGYVDLSDYRITQTLSKNVRTHGWLVVEEKGYLLNTDSLVGEAVIKGRVIGKLATENTLEIHSSAQLKGTITAGRLVIPPGHHFRWAEPLRARDAEIAGELAANLCASGTVLLRSTARFFGDIEAGGLVVEGGAVFVGRANVGPHRPAELQPAEVQHQRASEAPKPRPARAGLVSNEEGLAAEPGFERKRRTVRRP